MFGAVPSADFWLGIASLAVSILGGGLVMAWRLGRLEQRVDDLKIDVGTRVTDLKEDIGTVDRRVEAFLIRGWVDLVDRDRERR